MESTPEAIPRAWPDGAGIMVEAGGRSWRLNRPGNLEDLWQAMDSSDFQDERIPYWTELWPSSLGLCLWLERNRENIAGQLALDLGCGLGLAALVGTWLGARITGMDLDKDALAYCHKNALANNIHSVQWVCADWRQPAFASHAFSRLWAADIMYEKRFAGPVADFISFSLKKDGIAWIADPGRNIFTYFAQALNDRKMTLQPVFKISLPAAGASETLIGVTIWEIRQGLH